MTQLSGMESMKKAGFENIVRGASVIIDGKLAELHTDSEVRLNLI